MVEILDQLADVATLCVVVKGLFEWWSNWRPTTCEVPKVSPDRCAQNHYAGNVYLKAKIIRKCYAFWTITQAQKAVLRLREIRARMSEIAALPDDGLTTEIRSEADRLDVEYRTAETKLAAAIIAEPDPEVRTTATGDPETRERREIRGRTGHRGVP